MNIFALIVGFAALSGQPKNFAYQDSKAVFVDFQSAEYSLDLNVTDKKATGRTKIRFEQSEAGFVVFDLRSTFQEIRINGEVTTATRMSAPDKVTNFLIVNKATLPGLHDLEVLHTIDKDVSFKNQNASAAFWFSDIDDGELLEQYFPSNLEYDQYQMELLVKVIGNADPFKIFTNGDLLNRNPGEAVIRFPDYYNSAAPYFHLVPAKDFIEISEVFVSNKNKIIPLTIYGKKGASLTRYLMRAKATLNELEADYGSFPHEKLLVYGNELFPGGMEYHGATITNFMALAHEITHSYFGRGIMPSNGDAGWLDEAIASWRDKGYRRVDTLRQTPKHLAQRSPYFRYTPMPAYNQGAEIMAHFDARIVKSGDQRGLKSFLSKMLEDKLFKTWSTEEFQSQLELFTGEDLKSIFNPFVYNKGMNDFSFKNESPAANIFNEFHGRLTPKARKEIL